MHYRKAAQPIGRIRDLKQYRVPMGLHDTEYTMTVETLVGEDLGLDLWSETYLQRFQIGNSAIRFGL